MSTEKDEARAAVTELKESLQEVYPEGLPLLNKVERYSGELRRTIAGLKADSAQLTSTINAQRTKIVTLESLEGRLTQLEAEKKRLETEKAHLNRELFEVRKIVPEWQEIETEGSTFINVKAKCLRCGLHFVVCTWEPDRHTAESLHCPECGQQGRFMVWKTIPNETCIFEVVPGSDPLTDISLPMPCDGKKRRPR